MQKLILTAWTILTLIATPVAAQQKRTCPEGRSFTGDCIDSGRASAMRLSAIANTQPRISYTAPPWLPAYDHGGYVTKNYHEMNNIYFPPLLFRNTGVKP